MGTTCPEKMGSGGLGWEDILPSDHDVRGRDVKLVGSFVRARAYRRWRLRKREGCNGGLPRDQSSRCDSFGTGTCLEAVRVGEAVLCGQKYFTKTCIAMGKFSSFWRHFQSRQRGSVVIAPYSLRQEQDVH